MPSVVDVVTPEVPHLMQATSLKCIQTAGAATIRERYSDAWCSSSRSDLGSLVRSLFVLYTEQSDINKAIEDDIVVVLSRESSPEEVLNILRHENAPRSIYVKVAAHMATRAHRKAAVLFDAVDEMSESNDDHCSAQAAAAAERVLGAGTIMPRVPDMLHGCPVSGYFRCWSSLWGMAVDEHHLGAEPPDIASGCSSLFRDFSEESEKLRYAFAKEVWETPRVLDDWFSLGRVLTIGALRGHDEQVLIAVLLNAIAMSGCERNAVDDIGVIARVAGMSPGHSARFDRDLASLQTSEAACSLRRWSHVSLPI
nr:hypothetical protein [Kofleriaceae bacterium]